MRRAQGELRQTAREAQRTSTIGSRMGGLLATGAKVAGAGLLTGAGAAAFMGLKFDSLKQQAQIAFTTMLGSGSKARVFLNQLQGFAARTPFEFPDLVTASQRLMAMGFQAKQVVPTMTAIGDAVAGLGGNADVLQRVTLAMGQIQARGQATAGDIMQLTEAGIPAWKYLADVLGTNVAGAMQKVQKRQ